MITTYSFQDVDLVLAHPNVGTYTISGEGVGSVGVNMANDRTAHDTAADGSVMITKIKTRSGILPLVVQQTSSANKWLQRWSNYLESAPASEWARTTAMIRSKSTGETINCNGVTPQKMADKMFQAQGQNVTWNLMAADIQSDLV